MATEESSAYGFCRPNSRSSWLGSPLSRTASVTHDLELEQVAVERGHLIPVLDAEPRRGRGTESGS
jgi:hypothetical protein